MTRFRLFRAIAPVLLMTAAACASAQDAYPSKPIHFIVPASPGGPTDVVGRLVAQQLTLGIGQPVLVENRPGASATIGPAFVAKSAPDGYTLLFTSATPIVMVPYTIKNVPYDVQKDLLAVSNLGALPLALFVNANSPVTNIKQLVEEVKAKPQSANYGSFGNGTSAHILSELLVKQTNIKMVHVPYKGIAPELQDLVGGQIMMGAADIGTASGLVKGGKIRAIAIAGSQRSALMPEVPTFAEQGINGMEPLTPWFAVYAPAKTPKAIIDRLSVELVKLTKNPEFAAKLATFGIDPTGTTAERATEITVNDMAKWQAIVHDLPQISFE